MKYRIRLASVQIQEQIIYNTNARCVLESQDVIYLVRGWREDLGEGVSCKMLLEYFIFVCHRTGGTIYFQYVRSVKTLLMILYTHGIPA